MRLILGKGDGSESRRSRQGGFSGAAEMTYYVLSLHVPDGCLPTIVPIHTTPYPKLRHYRSPGGAVWFSQWERQRDAWRPREKRGTSNHDEHPTMIHSTRMNLQRTRLSRWVKLLSSDRKRRSRPRELLSMYGRDAVRKRILTPKWTDFHSRSGEVLASSAEAGG